MAETSSQSSEINTSQPTVLKGLKLSTHAIETVNVAHPTLEDRVMKINKVDYDEGTHGPILKDKLPKKKKKKAAADNGNENGKKAKKRKKKETGADSED